MHKVVFAAMANFLICTYASFQVENDYTAQGRLEVVISDSGSYVVLVDNKPWLRSAPTYFIVHNHKCNSENSCLQLISKHSLTGSDVLGKWQQIELSYVTMNHVKIVLSFRMYTAKSFVLFAQHFVTGISASSTGNRDNLSSAFPRFYVEQPFANTNDTIGYFAYGGIMFGDTEKSYGIWGNMSANIVSGLDSGPLVLLSKTGNTLIISPFNHFMSASAVYASDGGRETVSWGIMGQVEEIPADFSYWTIMYLSGQGINQAFSEWGAVMRKKYNRPDSSHSNDITIKYIGFWTDNGAYYYYNTENGTSYEKTLLEAKTYATKYKIPYRYVQYDSWWYYKGSHRGTTNWTSMYDVFPNGLRYIWEKTGWPVLAHNRFWSDKNVYAKQNGGKFPFIIEQQTHKGIPLSMDFWDSLFQTAKQWGLVVYEQDWLNKEFDEMNATVSQIGLARAWLLQMGTAADKQGICLQYCMAPSRAALQTLEVPAVSQARVSNDYQPSGANWMIGMSSMFAHALGVTPFKDNFWTTAVQPGNPYNKSELYTVLNSIVATLSTGPVAIGDRVGYSNVSLIMKSCNADGLILKSSRPVLAVDKQYLQAIFHKFPGQLWSTYSDIAGLRFGIIFGVDIVSDQISIGPTEAGFGRKFPRSKVFTQADVVSGNAVKFTDERPLVLNRCTRDKPCLYYTAPVITFKGHDLLLYGELSKWVMMSAQRVTDIVISSDDIRIHVIGSSSGEVITFAFGYRGGVHRITCHLARSGCAVISFAKKFCRNQ